MARRLLATGQNPVVLKSATFTESRWRAVPGVLGGILFVVVAIVFALIVDDAGEAFQAAIVTVFAFVFLGIQAKRLFVPHRLHIDHDGFAEIGPYRGSRTDVKSWSDIGPVSTIQSDHVNFSTKSGWHGRTLYTYGIRARVLAALMNDLRLDQPEFEGTEEAAERARVTSEDVFHAANQPEMIRTIEPLGRSTTLPPEASGEFLMIGRTEMSHHDLIKSNGGRTTRCTVGEVETDVYFHLGETRLSVIAFVPDGGGCHVCAPIGAELATAFWTAYNACDGRLGTI